MYTDVSKYLFSKKEPALRIFSHFHESYPKPTRPALPSLPLAMRFRSFHSFSSGKNAHPVFPL